LKSSCQNISGSNGLIERLQQCRYQKAKRPALKTAHCAVKDKTGLKVMHLRNNAHNPADNNRTEHASPAASAGTPAHNSTNDRFFQRSMHRLRRHIPPIMVVLLILFISFCIGFVVFTEHVSNLKAPDANEKSDAIIVLTGGKARIEVALELLAAKRGERLLISGVHPSTKREALQRLTKTDPALFKCCVDLDRSALNTIGNAKESAKWISEHDYKRIFIVTNNYHMPRSILELSRQIAHQDGDVELIPYPVINSDLKQTNWIRQGDMLRVLLTEYIKYIGALAYLSLGFSE
jgi:uncharacterized SAM-binding protein YcdF (DUF218 family)